MVIRVLVVDDQPLVRRGLRTILETEPGLELCGEAGDGEAAVDAAARWHPDVVLMDVRMPRVDGIEATRRIVARQPDVRVLVLTTFDLDEHVYAAIRAGASGFVLKDVAPDDLVHAVHVVAGGESVLAPTVTSRMVERYVDVSRLTGLQDPRFSGLTEREVEVFVHLARGRSNAEIGADLFLSPATVKTHVARVLTKLGLRDRVQAVVLAYETGVVRPGEGTTDAGADDR